MLSPKLSVSCAAAVGLVLGAFPGIAVAQNQPLLPLPTPSGQTEPILPAPTPPTGPNLPALAVPPLQHGETVVTRARPELDPLGVPVGPFFFYPRAQLGEAYNDNIFATSSGTKSDFITVLAPSFDLRSNFGTNALNLSAGAAVSWYASNTNFNNQDAFVRSDGRLDVDNVHDFHGAANFARLHEDPGNPNVAGNAAQPVQYLTYGGNTGFEQTKLRVVYSADLAAQRSEYSAVPAIGGGLIQESDRNNWSYELALRGGYEFQPNYQVYVRGAANIRDYDHAPLGAPGRNSHGFRIDVGTRIDLTGVTYVEAYVGYLDQIYQASSFGSVSGADVGANIVWNVTQLTSITGTVVRNVQDAPVSVVGATVSPGYLHTGVGFRVDHELLRNLLLDGQLAYINDDYTGENRTDNDYVASVGAKYLLNRNLYLGATYAFERRLSSGAESVNPYSRNIVMLRASTQF
jgi:hypothetical protein